MAGLGRAPRSSVRAAASGRRVTQWDSLHTAGLAGWPSELEGVVLSKNLKKKKKPLMAVHSNWGEGLTFIVITEIYPQEGLFSGKHRTFTLIKSKEDPWGRVPSRTDMLPAAWTTALAPPHPPA